MQQYFVEQTLEEGTTIPCPDEIRHHLQDVMRANEGQVVRLIDQAEKAFEGKVCYQEGHLHLAIDTPVHLAVELPIKVTIVCGLPKKDKAEWIVQKATELGAYEIVFMEMERSVTQWVEKKVNKKLARLETIARQAAQQSQRPHIPSVRFIQQLTDLPLEEAQVYLADEELAKDNQLAFDVQAIDRGPSTLIAIFGPEGGISEKERESVLRAGGHGIALGPRILRCETAPLYFLSGLSVLVEGGWSCQSKKI